MGAMGLFLKPTNCQPPNITRERGKHSRHKRIDDLHAKVRHVAHVARDKRHAVPYRRSGNLGINDGRHLSLLLEMCNHFAPKVCHLIIKRNYSIPVLGMAFVNPT